MIFNLSYILYLKQIDISKVVLVWFSLIKPLFVQKIFSGTCTLRGKDDVQLNFDNSYILYVNRIDIFKLFCVIFHKLNNFF